MPLCSQKTNSSGNPPQDVGVLTLSEADFRRHASASLNPKLPAKGASVPQLSSVIAQMNFSLDFANRSDDIASVLPAEFGSIRIPKRGVPWSGTLDYGGGGSRTAR